jgi:putative transposase
MANEPLQYGRYYHIFNRGNNGEILFAERRNYRFFLQRYAQHIQPVAETYAYCLLPNHFHFGIRTRTEEEQEAYLREEREKNGPSSAQQQNGPILEIGPFSPTEPSRAFNNLFISYSRAFSIARKRTGALFERPFGRKIVTSHRYLLTLIAYIHRNPQRHGLVDDFREWPWSSYGALVGDGLTKVRRDEVLAWYNGRDAFVEAHLAEMDERLIAPLLLEDWF